MNERRKSARLDLNGKIIIKPLGSNASPESATIDITDCSQFGLGFNSDRQLTIGDIYEAFLTIWTKEVLHVILQIVRYQKTATGYNYGCIFIGMPATDRQRIAVFETLKNYSR